MSGHSKWSTIKRQKGAADAKRGQLFTKLSNAITLAVKQGGGITDPSLNFRLRLAIDAAKSANMPKENIERAVKRALGKEVGMMDEVRYEGFGPGGFSCLIIAATDNKQRTSAEIRHLFEKHAGNLGDSGAVAYQFALCGFILAQKEGRSLDEMFLIAADCGAEDVEDAGDSVIIYTKPDDLGNARDELIKKGVNVSEAKLIYKPTILMPITDPEKAKAAISFISSLEEHPDVQEVFTNLEIPDELIV